MNINVHGEASPTGFELSFLYFPGDMLKPGETKEGIEIAGHTAQHTKNYIPDPVLKSARGVLAWFLLLSGGVAGFWFLGYVLVNPIDYSLLPFSILLFVFIIVWARSAGSFIAALPVLKNRKLRQWHGCEHKLAILYADEGCRTRKALQNTPRDSKDCGTMPTCRSFLWPIVIVAVFLEITLLNEWFFVVPLVLVSLAAARLLRDRIALLFQKTLLTAEPHDHHYDAALTLAAQLDAKIERSTPPFREAQFVLRGSA